MKMSNKKVLVTARGITLQIHIQACKKIPKLCR